jgi:NAD(P)-dependent dehydrogenase (short-subunit alcohol dehydrogenase family)
MADLAALHDPAGQVAIATGTRGVGLAILEAFAVAGADVVVSSGKPEACETVAADIATSTGRPAEPIGCHVGHWDDCDRLIAETTARMGRRDVFVNNSGMSPQDERLDAITEELHDKTVAVNLRGRSGSQCCPACTWLSTTAARSHELTER